MHMTKARLRTAASGVLAAGVLGVLLAASSQQAGSFIAHDGPTASGELVVHFRGDVPLVQQEALLQAHGATLSGSLLVPGYVVASVLQGSEAEVGQALAQSALVSTAEENPIRQPAAIPNDPYYPQQWNLPAIGLNSVWSKVDGSGVTVAVIDTGVAYEDYLDGATDFAQAPDLSATTFVLPFDFYKNDAHANDDYGHGTHVAGTIAENTNNGSGAAGIAPKAKIMPIKVCGTNPTTHQYGCPDDKLAEGIEYAVQNGARVINLSIAGPEQINQAVRDALDHARQASIVVVAASGNDKDGGHPTLDYPAAVDGVFAVGAVGFLLGRAGYSNYGKGEGSNQLELVAPGGDPTVEGGTSVIYQQTYSSCTAATNFTQFLPATACSGTSMAAAHVSGVAALIRSKFPGLTATQVRADLRCSADDLGTAGVDQQFGYGLVRADAALTDIDHDGTPDCIDSSVLTPHPTPRPPDNECYPPTFTPPPPTLSPSPTESAPPPPTSSGPTVTAISTATQILPTDTGTPTSTATETATATPTDTPTATPSDTPTARGQTDSPTPSPTPTPTPVPTPIVTPRPICGDVDCSGAVNAADALGLLRWLTEAPPNPQCIGLGYVNCDGQLDVVDATVILRHSAALPINLPAGCPGFS
jgi:serine protease